MKKNGQLNLIPPIELRQTDTIFDALKNIEGKHWMIVTVVDDQGCLVGVASPGDLRRAILQGHPVSTTLKRVMNDEPILIEEEQLKKTEDVNQVLEDMKAAYGDIYFRYAMAPVVRKDKKVVGLINLDSLTVYVSKDQEPMATNHRTVLIVGGGGYIGSTLARVLLNDGWSVRVLDKFIYYGDSLKGIDNNRFELMEGDAANIDDIVRAVDGVDAVVYLAELVGDPACAEAPQAALKTNYLAVTSMAHLCSHLNINRFVYMSSCSVYGASENPDEFLTEESALNPVSLYARIKSLVEESILSVCNLPNPLFAPTILRLATVFGPSYRPRFDLVVNIFAKNAYQNKKIEVHGGGNQWRPNVHVKDVAGAINAVLNAPIDDVRAQTFNVGGDAQNHTINDLAELTKQVFPATEIIRNSDLIDPRNYRVSFEKLERVVGFKAKHSVVEALQEFKELFENKSTEDLDSLHFSNVRALQALKYS